MIAEENEIEVHGVLWIIDELHHHNVEARRTLFQALKSFQDDPAVRLPRAELLAAIRRYGNKR